MGRKTIRTSAKESRGPASDSALRWSVERRLAFIDERLFWLGEVNRTDLMGRFGVSLGQASTDIARYLAHAPEGVFYDKTAKRYLADASFRPVLAAPDAARFLSELLLVNAGLLPVEHTLFGLVPPFDATPVPERKADPSVLRAVLGAVRKALVLDVMYQSMNRPEPTRRLIEPHALAYDGFRWHVRAFDRETGEFRDFVLGRLSKPKPAGPARSRAKDDRDWHGLVELKIAPHPRLTPAQAKAIALDYGISKGKAVIRVRRALLFYALRRLGLDVGPDIRPPHEQHIVLVNRGEIDALRSTPNQT
jgi:predicted DNA-binding transcriptional regulator YafY